MAEGRRPNDGPASRWIFTGIPVEPLMDTDWVNVCLSLVLQEQEEKTVDDFVLEKRFDKSATKSIN